MEHIQISNLATREKIQFINNGNFFEGTITEIQEKVFAVVVTTKQVNFFPLIVGNEIEFIVTTTHIAYKCVSTIIGTKITDQLQLVLLSPPMVLTKIERRKHPRVTLIREIKYCNLPDSLINATVDEVPYTYNLNMKKTFTVDISAGGISLITFNHKTDKDIIYINLLLEENIRAICSVVRSDYDEATHNYRTGLEFKHINKYQWKLINSYVDEKINSKSQ